MTLLILEVTTSCNLRCAYCLANAEAKGSKMSRGTAVNAIRKVLAMPSCHTCLTIEFTGGEPLLNLPLIQSIVPWARRLAEREGKSLTFTVQTNGVLLTDRVAAWLVENGVEVGISLDGAAATQDSVRTFPSGRGSFDAVVRGVKTMKAHAGHACILAVIHNPGQYREVAELCIQYGIEALKVNPLKTLGRGVAWSGRASLLHKQPMAYAQAYYELFSYLLEYNRTHELQVREGHLVAYLKNLLLLQDYMCFRTPCGAGMNQIYVDSGGNIYPCQEWLASGALPIANVNRAELLHNRFSEAPLIGDLRHRSRNDINGCCECPWKRFCGACPVEACGLYGRIDRPEPSCDFHRYMFGHLIWDFAERKDAVFQYILGLPRSPVGHEWQQPSFEHVS